MVTMESTQIPYLDQGWGSTVSFSLESVSQLGMEGMPLAMWWTFQG